jgi:predicted DNA-binding protein (MmcQ/YjbR family)
VTADELRGWCLGRFGAEETFPFNASTSVFKVGGKMFALSALSEEPLQVSVKCDPDYAEELRESHESIIPGYHLNKRHWITVTLGGDAGDDLVRMLIAESHALVAPWRSRSRSLSPGRDDGLTPHARVNRAAWDGIAEELFVPAAERRWVGDEPAWGIWEIPERDLLVLPDVAGLDVVELGCGTAFWSAWLARRGARPVGVDNSSRQLATARRLQREHGLEFPLVHASAEAVPLEDGGFDLAFSEYGACLWCDPELWIPEAARLLRPGGLLVFLTHTPIVMLCIPDFDGFPTSDRLVRPYFGMRRFDWPDHPSTEFNLTYGGWIAELRRSGFAVEALHELQAPEDGDPGPHDYVTADWSHRWPQEAIWVARKGA